MKKVIFFIFILFLFGCENRKEKINGKIKAPTFSTQSVAKTKIKRYSKTQKIISNNFVRKTIETETDITTQETVEIIGTVKNINDCPITGIVVKIIKKNSGAKINFSKKIYLSGPTDCCGQFIISNVVAPGIYKVALKSKNYRLEEQKEIVTKPDVSTICNLIAFTEAKIFIHVVEENGEPVPEYFLRIDSAVGEQNGWRHIKVDQIKNPWFRVMPFGWQRTAETFIDVSAKYHDQLSETVTNLSWQANEEKYITLTLHPQAPQITGRLFYYDGAPAAEKAIYAKVKRTGKEVRVMTESDGYFEITGLNEKTNSVIELTTFNYQYSVTTNVLNGSRNIIFRLGKQRKIIGKVFYDNLENVATNFNVISDDVVKNPSFNKTFQNENGEFEIDFEGGYYSITISAENYAAKKIHVDFSKNIICDVGNIILHKEDASVEGRVINHLGEPIFTEVLLHYGNFRQNVSYKTKTNPNDGSYSFQNVPEGDANISVTLTFPYLFGEIRSIKIRDGETTFAPDLVIWTTNMYKTEITLLMPDGSPAANIMIKNHFTMTDSQGKVILWLPESQGNIIVAQTGYQRTQDGFSYCGSCGGSKKYFSESFDITPQTYDLTLSLMSPSKISGFITKDNLPFTGRLIFFNKDNLANSSARNGRFTVELPSGDYFVISPKQALISRVKLESGENNKIVLKKENGKIIVKIPDEKSDDWKVCINYEFPAEKKSFNLYTSNIDARKGTFSFENMPRGDYLIVAKRFGKYPTNLYKRVYLKAEKTETISF